ncbi:hypothetical protein BDR07DRAFT_1482099 [Suillus spraguei]|nr:hypothetical protein BDR07DRAFT_1482099 [Suillus spraguei]
MILLTFAALILFTFFLGVAVGVPNRHAGPAVRGRAILGIIRLPREAQCAVCPEDIEQMAVLQRSSLNKGLLMGSLCARDYKESSGTEIVCPYVTDTGELNGTVEYCPQTTALGDCVNN